MPRYTPSDEEMDELYSSQASSPMKQKPEPESVDKEIESESEVVVSKDQLPSGMKEGDTCTFKITKDYGDEVGIEYVKQAGKKSDMAQADEELEALSATET